MIQVDISNVWSAVSLTDLLSIEAELSAAHLSVSGRSCPGSEYLGWLDLPDRAPTAEHMRLLAAAHRIRETSDALVVIGTGCCAGPRAAISLLQGPNRNLRCSKGDPMILWAGESLSTRSWEELQRLLEGKDFSICVLGRTGTTLESAIAFRNLKWMLERRFGTAQSKRRVYAVTDPEHGALRQMAAEEGWECFPLPTDVDERFSVLTPAGMLPMATAGLDVMALLKGAARAKTEYDLRSFENPVWLYTAVRYLMHRRGMCLELLESFEPGFGELGCWWQQLFANAEGRQGQGLYPVWGELPRNLHTMGQLIQEGGRSLFETLVRFDPPVRRTLLLEDIRDLEGLNYLAGKHLDFVQEQAYQSTMASHADGGCPVIAIDCGPLNEETLGGLFWFFQLSCAVSACLLGVDPADRSGLGAYERDLLRRLGKPGI